MPKNISRRTFIKGSALAAGACLTGQLPELVGTAAAEQGKQPVFFTDDISLAGLLKIYARVNQGMTGKTGIKLHSGEPHGPNLLPLELIRGLQATIPGSVLVECNVLYDSPRQKTESHRETLKTNGFDFCPVDIMDADGDAMLPVHGVSQWMDGTGQALAQSPMTPGLHLAEVAVGRNLLNYDSLLVYTHFKGHAMGGFGGSLKNISIGCASGKVGKQQIHGEGWPTGPLFLERMVEGGKAVADHFGSHITYINVLKNISIDCDCDAHGAKPTCRDIGIVASTDILAVDKASIDLVYAQPDDQRHDIVERIESRSGLHQLTYMKTLGMGNDQYDLIRV